ncbi:MAG: response regulator [Eubacteriales bacterium]|jgi:two-component system LytT family response regulator
MRVIYVDDELPARDNFRLTVSRIQEIKHLHLFEKGEEALEYAKTNAVDAAFLDMEMPGLHGLALAVKLHEINKSIRVIFVTAFSQYAMEAWKVNARGYVLKPYTEEDIRNELEKCLFQPLPTRRIVVQTIPTLAITVEGDPVHISGEKAREMFALLVDRADSGITAREGISYLWPDRLYDSNTQALFRMTYKRLADTLDAAGIGHIIASSDNRRYIRVEEVDCDLYRILSGDQQVAVKYDGQYLQEYSWAEDRNGQLYRMLLT